MSTPSGAKSVAADESSIDKETKNRVYYEVETSTGSKTIVVYRVHEVYVHIPPELSAAGFELKIGGTVIITDQQEEFHLKWSPDDLTQQDVASLYSAQTDSWTLVDEFIEPPEIIDSCDHKYPDREYRVDNLEMPESILTNEGSNVKFSKGGTSFSKSSPEKTAVHYSNDGDIKISELRSRQSPPLSRADAINFPLSKLHSIRETGTQKKSLTVFLADGRELPTLHFHDGGSTGLLHALQRYVFLERDSRSPSLYRVKNYDKNKQWLKGKPKPLTEESSSTEVARPVSPGHKKRLSKSSVLEGSQVHELLQGAVSGVVGNFVGITRAVRQRILPDKQLLETRPGTENDDFDEIMQTYVCSDVPPSSPEAVSPSASSKKEASPQPDPEASLITDFQVVTDIRGKLPPLPSAQPRLPPVTVEEWERFRDDWGRISKENELKFKARVFYGGLKPEVRKEAWKYLLGFFPFDLTDIERMELRDQRESEYWSMKNQWQSFTPDQERRFSKWRELKHLINKDVLRTDRDNLLFNDPDSPKLVQLEDILKTYVMYNFDLGYVQGMSDLLAPLLAVMENEVDSFWCFVGFMETVDFHSKLLRVYKRTSNEFLLNPDSQGCECTCAISVELVATFLFSITTNEKEHHFEITQAGMRTRLKQLRALLSLSDDEFYEFLKEKDSNNLYFCFRWLLVHFKREFSYDDIMCVWEVIWTRHLSPDFSLFIALAILLRERDHLINPKHDFSDILQHINSLTKNIPLPSVLELAEVLCRQFGTCPSLPDNLELLIIKPLPERLSPDCVPKIHTDTIVCNPNSRAVPID